MNAGNTIHINGIRAEYRLYGKKAFNGCIMPDGDYVVMSIERGHVNLAWKETDGEPSRKHRYRVADHLILDLLRTRQTRALDQTS
jgi:hypothetical protein